MSTTTFSAGDVLLVRVPHTDLSGFKQRPAVVLWSNAYNLRLGDMLVMALTSIPQADSGLALTEWLKAAIATVAERLVAHRLGSVSAGDFGAVRYAVRQCIDGQWF